VVGEIASGGWWPIGEPPQPRKSALRISSVQGTVIRLPADVQFGRSSICDCGPLVPAIPGFVGGGRALMRELTLPRVAYDPADLRRKTAWRLGTGRIGLQHCLPRLPSRRPLAWTQALCA